MKIPRPSDCRIALFLDRGNGLRGLEGETAERALRRLLLPDTPDRPDIPFITDQRPLMVEDLGRAGTCGLCMVVSDRTLVTRQGVEALADIALRRREFDAVGPVSNLSRIPDQTCPPPFLYQTPSVFKWAATEIHKTFGNQVLEVSELDDFCLLFRRESVNGLPGELPVARLAQSLRGGQARLGIARGSMPINMETPTKALGETSFAMCRPMPGMSWTWGAPTASLARN